MSNARGNYPEHPWFDVEMRSLFLVRTRDYWRQIKGDRLLPARADFIISDLEDVVPHLALVDVKHDPIRLSFRMLGTFVTDIAGRNSAGKCLDRELFPDNLEQMTWAYSYSAEHRVPIATEGPVDFADRDWTGSEVLFLPLSDDGETVSMVASCYDLMDRRKDLVHEAGDVIINWEK